MFRPWTKDDDHTIPNILLCAWLVLLESAQLLIGLVLIFSFIPIPVAPVVHTLFPRHQQLVMPGREMLFYRVWALLLIAGQTALLAAFKHQLKSPKLFRRLLPLCMVESVWSALMVFAVFKIFVYGHPAWAYHSLYVFLAGSVLSKIFWKELKSGLKACTAYFMENPSKLNLGADILVPLLIVAVLYVPDLKAAVARMWIGDCLHHFDTALMAQAWAYLKGAAINMDVYEHYGLGFPIVMGLLAKGLGLFSYEGMLALLIWISILYFIFSYFFLRAWLNSVPAAVVGVLWALKWKMFHPGVYPFVFTYPDTTVIRHVFDLAFLFLVLRHLQSGRFYALAAAAAVCGLGLFYVSDTGVYLFVAFVFYLAWLLLEAWGSPKFLQNTLRPVLICLVSAPALAFVLFCAFQGAHAWSGELWSNMYEQIELFLAGHGDLPMYKSLLDGDYMASFMSFAIPLAYAGILLVTVSLCYLKKIDRQNIMAAVVAVYGMGLFHYYVCRAADTSYYTVGLPFAFLLGWLCVKAGPWLSIRGRHAFWAAAVLLSLFALLSNHYVLSYPNLLNFSANPYTASDIRPVVKGMDHYFNNIPLGLSPALKLPANSLGEQEEELKVETDFKNDAEFKEFFTREFDFQEDAALLDRLTKAGEKAALISSFETKILMQADRASLFYYFPVIDSRPMRARIFPFSSLLSTHRLNKTLNELDNARPAYLFMEKILLAEAVPSSYAYLYPELLEILRYVHQHYEPYQEGRYLIAMKRKSP